MNMRKRLEIMHKILKREADSNGEISLQRLQELLLLNIGVFSNPTIKRYLQGLQIIYKYEVDWDHQLIRVPKEE